MAIPRRSASQEGEQICAPPSRHKRGRVTVRGGTAAARTQQLVDGAARNPPRVIRNGCIRVAQVSAPAPPDRRLRRLNGPVAACMYEVPVVLAGDGPDRVALEAVAGIRGVVRLRVG